MLPWLAGGALGAILGALGVGLLLWRERSLRASAELERTRLRSALAAQEKSNKIQQGLISVQRRIVARKEARIAELEAQLAALDPGSLLDDVFGGVRETPPAGSDPAD